MDSSSPGDDGGVCGHRFPLEPRPLSRTSARYPASAPPFVRDSNENPENLERCDEMSRAGVAARRRRIPARVSFSDGHDPNGFSGNQPLARIFPRLLCVVVLRSN